MNIYIYYNLETEEFYSFDDINNAVEWTVDNGLVQSPFKPIFRNGDTVVQVAVAFVQ